MRVSASSFASGSNPGQGPAKPGAACCPRCGGVLKFPETIGACMACGYSRADAGLDAPPPRSKRKKTEQSELGEIFLFVRRLPGWIWGILLGCIVITGLSLWANQALDDDAMQRTHLSTVELVAGLCALVAGQMWVLFLVSIEDKSLALMDGVSPLRCWRLAVSHLPLTGRPLCLGVCGLTSVICAFALVGGLAYWMPKKTETVRSRGFLPSFAKGDGGKKKSIEESLKDLEPAQGSKHDPKEKLADHDTRPTREAMIIGYIPGQDGTLSRLLLALDDKGQLRYAGMVERGWTPDQAQQLPTRFASLIQAKPVIAHLPIEAVWLKPVLRCTVHQSGTSATGLLMEPSLAELIFPKPTSTAAATTSTSASTPHVPPAAAPAGGTPPDR